MECLKKNCQNRILHNKKKNTKKKLLDTKSLNISGVKKKESPKSNPDTKISIVLD